MVGRDGFEPSTNWLKAKRVKCILSFKNSALTVVGIP